MSLSVAGAAHAEWRPLARGMEFGVFSIANHATRSGQSEVTIVRIDPVHWELLLIGNSWDEGLPNRSARGWARTQGLTAAINAGMFATDYSTHIGFLVADRHFNNRRVNHYQSVAAFDPVPDKALPEFRIFDLDDPEVTMNDIRANYGSVVQNLRLIKRPGENRWSQQDRKWSEAALGEDGAGRILFILSRSPLTMHDLNEALLALDIDLVAAQHLEGGPEAQLFVETEDMTLDVAGGYDTSLRWRIPNVLGVRPRR